MKTITHVKKVDDRMVKYNITYNEEKLLEIKNKLDKEAVILEHRSLDSGYPFSREGKRNVKATRIEGSEYQDKETGYVYYSHHYEYDEPVYLSPLIGMIDWLVNYERPDQIVSCILGIEKFIDTENINQKINNTIARITDILNTTKDIKKTRKEVDKLEVLLKQSDIVDIEYKYLEEIKKLVTIKEKESISVQEYKHALSFKDYND